MGDPIRTKEFLDLATKPGVPNSVQPVAKPNSEQQFTRNNKVWNSYYETASCCPSFWHVPETESDLISILRYAKSHNENVRVVGSGHSIDNIACADDHLVSMERFSRVLSIDKNQKLVKVNTLLNNYFLPIFHNSLLNHVFLLKLQTLLPFSLFFQRLNLVSHLLN